MNLLIDSRSDSGVKVKQQQFNIELFKPYLGRSDRSLTTVRQRFDTGGLRSDIRSNSSGATVERYRCDSGVTAAQQRRDSGVATAEQ